VKNESEFSNLYDAVIKPGAEYYVLQVVVWKEEKGWSERGDVGGVEGGAIFDALWIDEGAAFDPSWHLEQSLVLVQERKYPNWTLKALQCLPKFNFNDFAVSGRVLNGAIQYSKIDFGPATAVLRNAPCIFAHTEPNAYKLISSLSIPGILNEKQRLEIVYALQAIYFGKSGVLAFLDTIVPVLYNKTHVLPFAKSTKTLLKVLRAERFDHFDFFHKDDVLPEQAALNCAGAHGTLKNGTFVDLWVGDLLLFEGTHLGQLIEFKFTVKKHDKKVKLVAGNGTEIVENETVGRLTFRVINPRLFPETVSRKMFEVNFFDEVNMVRVTICKTVQFAVSWQRNGKDPSPGGFPFYPRHDADPNAAVPNAIKAAPKQKADEERAAPKRKADDEKPDGPNVDGAKRPQPNAAATGTTAAIGTEEIAPATSVQLESSSDESSSDEEANAGGSHAGSAPASAPETALTPTKPTPARPAEIVSQDPKKRPAEGVLQKTISKQKREEIEEGLPKDMTREKFETWLRIAKPRWKSIVDSKRRADETQAQKLAAEQAKIKKVAELAARKTQAAAKKAENATKAATKQAQKEEKDAQAAAKKAEKQAQKEEKAAKKTEQVKAAKWCMDSVKKLRPLAMHGNTFYLCYTDTHLSAVEVKPKQLPFTTVIIDDEPMAEPEPRPMIDDAWVASGTSNKTNLEFYEHINLKTSNAWNENKVKDWIASKTAVQLFASLQSIDTGKCFVFYDGKTLTCTKTKPALLLYSETTAIALDTNVKKTAAQQRVEAAKKQQENVPHIDEGQQNANIIACGVDEATKYAQIKIKEKMSRVLCTQAYAGFKGWKFMKWDAQATNTSFPNALSEGKRDDTTIYVRNGASKETQNIIKEYCKAFGGFEKLPIWNADCPLDTQLSTGLKTPEEFDKFAHDPNRAVYPSGAETVKARIAFNLVTQPTYDEEMTWEVGTKGKTVRLGETDFEKLSYDIRNNGLSGFAPLPGVPIIRYRRCDYRFFEQFGIKEENINGDYATPTELKRGEPLQVSTLSFKISDLGQFMIEQPKRAARRNQKTVVESDSDSDSD
jgi:hypothetical protein